MLKVEARTLFKKISKEIKEKENRSEEIVSEILSLDVYKKSKVIALYSHSYHEPNMDLLFIKAIEDKKIILYPKVIDKERMEFYQVSSLDELKIGSFNIKEPISNIKIDNIDLIIVPALVYDKRGFRVGHGMGYYDRYLKNKDIYKIGVTYNELLVDKIEENDFDIKVNYLVSR